MNIVTPNLESNRSQRRWAIFNFPFTHSALLMKILTASLVIIIGLASRPAMADSLANTSNSTSQGGGGANDATAVAASGAQPMVAGINDASMRNDFTGTVGYTFTTSSNSIRVTALGYADGTGKGKKGSGLQAAHTVSLWDADGTLVAAVTVPEGVAAGYKEGYWYMPLNPSVTLAPGKSYTIGATETDGGDLWPSSLSTNFPGFSSPVFSGMTPLGEGNAVFGFDTGNSAPPNQQDGVGTMVWLTCNLMGSNPASAFPGQPAKQDAGHGQIQSVDKASEKHEP